MFLAPEMMVVLDVRAFVVVLTLQVKNLHWCTLGQDGCTG
jgi:hypothetical protein